MQEHCLKKSW